MIGVHHKASPSEPFAASSMVNITITPCSPTMIMSAHRHKNIESLGWVDLPFTVQKEEHPSTTSRCRTTTTTTTRSYGWGDFPIATEEVLTESTKLHNNNCRQPPSTPRQPTKLPKQSLPTKSFGWVDFPLVHQYATTPRRNVRFSPQVRMRTHALCLGDHPLCDGAYPLALDWAATEEHLINEEQHSNGRSSCPPRRLDVEERRSRLSNVLGLPLTEVDRLERERTSTFGSLQRTKSGVGWEQTQWQSS